MSHVVDAETPEEVVSALRAHEIELRQAGIQQLSLFGSVARGSASRDSDVDLLAELDPAAQVGLFRLVALERHLKKILRRRVDLVAEPGEKPSLRASIERDRRRVF
jgi:uncharacterized protein